MFVTWLTFDDNIFATVEYGTSPRALNLTANGTITLFIDGGSLQTQRYISRVTLTGLEPGTTYCESFKTQNRPVQSIMREASTVGVRSSHSRL